jgi:hypothetical protein
MQNSGAGKAILTSALCALVTLSCLAIPIYVIRPFVPQGARALTVALEVRLLAPLISGLCVVIGFVAAIWGLKRSRRIRARVTLVLLVMVTVAGALATHINIFEKMFHPYDAPSFAPASQVSVDADDKVLAVTLGGEAHAYPIRTMGYHHIVNDTLGNVPIAVTYCTLCHTGLVWNRNIAGKTLHFRLAGINNGNALLRDVQTGSIWQQSTGEAIFGPLKGQHLQIVPSNELTFALWRSERPHGQVLVPDPAYVADYDPKDWEKHIALTHVVVDTSASGIDPHRLMLGITLNGQNKAYPLDILLHEKLVEDEIAGAPLLLLVGPDGASVRTFAASLGGENAMTFVNDNGIPRDVETASTWNFQGCAVSGPMTGRCLTEVESHKDYWFDWMNHHPATVVFHDE